VANPSRTIQQLMDLSGKVALVTGGSGYLGMAIAHAMAELGARVILTSRDADRARSAAATLPQVEYGPHGGVAMNQLDIASVRRAFDEAITIGGRVDILFNNAHERTVEDWRNVSEEDFSRDLRNCTAFFSLARLMRDHVVTRGARASIVNVGSMYGMVGSYPQVYEGITAASPVSYHATKGAVVQLTRHLAVYWAKDGVRVNCLCPGPFPYPTADARMIARLNEKVPMGRVGEAWEVKGVAAFLASDASSYVTGQILLVDGGWTAW